MQTKYKGACQLCYKFYWPREYIIWNPEKKKGRHVDCDSVKYRDGKNKFKQFNHNNSGTSVMNVKK